MTNEVTQQEYDFIQFAEGELGFIFQGKFEYGGGLFFGNKTIWVREDGGIYLSEETMQHHAIKHKRTSSFSVNPLVTKERYFEAKKSNMGMINERELRIGNYILYNGIMVKVMSVIHPYPTGDRFSDKWVLDLYDGAGIITCTIEEIEPIPLIEELLLRLGAERKPHRMGTIGNFHLHGIPIVMSNSGNFYYKQKPVIYLHKLQNLIYELVDKELTLK